MLEDARWGELREGEEEVYATHPSKWMVYQRILVGVLSLGFIGVALSQIPVGWLSVWVIPGWALVLTVGTVVLSLPVIYAMIRRRTTAYVITTRGIWYKKGIYAADPDPIDWEDVADKDPKQSVFDRIVGKGDVAVMTKGTGDVEVVFHDIPDPFGVVEIFDKARDQHRQAVRDHKAGKRDESHDISPT